MSTVSFSDKDVLKPLPSLVPLVAGAVPVDSGQL